MSGTTAGTVRTSRRVIVKTGARLAYAAPLVAASTRIGQSSAGALSAPVFGPDLTLSLGASSCAAGIPVRRSLIVSGSGWTPGHAMFITATGTGVFSASNAAAIVGAGGTFGPTNVGFASEGGGSVQITATDTTVIDQVVETFSVSAEALPTC